MSAEERYFLPLPTKAGLVDVAADTAHLVSILRQRVLARSAGSPTMVAEAGPGGVAHVLEDMEELRGLLFGATHDETTASEAAPPQTPVSST